jgi:hypothetical protein
MAEPRIPLRQGRNVWRLWRTDRDGASTSEVTASVGPAVRSMLRRVEMSDPWDIVRTDGGTGNPRWRIGAARPVELTSLTRYKDGTRAPSLGVPRKGVTVLAERGRYPGDTLPTVRGKTPWWVVVDVWWRKPDTTLPWPGFRVTLLGYRQHTVVDADWVLERAVYVPPPVEVKPDPGDSTATEAHTEAAASAVRVALPPMLIVAGLALLAYSQLDPKRLLR